MRKSLDRSDMHRPSSLGSRAWVSVAIASLLYLVLFLGLHSKWLAVAGDSVAATAPTGVADARLIVWVLDWVYGSLTDWTRILNAPINHPVPAQLTGTEHFGSFQLLYAPLRVLTGDPLLAANLTAILTYPLTATGMYAFLLAAGVAPLAAFAAGAALALGPFQTPGNLHVLQHLPLFLPLTALALLRLRRQPDWGRAFALTLILLVAVCGSYYTAMMLYAAMLVWVPVEVATARQPRRLALLVGFSFLIAAAVLVLLSIPYLARADHPGRPPWSGLSWQPTAVWNRLYGYAIGSKADSLGVPLLGAAALGVFALGSRDLRRYALASMAVAAAGIFLALGGTLLVASWELPAIGTFADFVARFFYIFPRGILLAGFAGSVLAAVGIEALRRFQPAAGNLAAIVFLFAVLFTRGASARMSVFSPVDAFGELRGAYQQVRLIIADAGGGSLLELPRKPREQLYDSRAMMGQLIHRAPLITGHTGYQPAERRAVDVAVRRLPAADALAELVRTTDLRWIVLRPRDDWSPRDRETFLRGLQVSHSVRVVHHAGELILLEVRELGKS